jgi:hypothetical protein
MQQPKYEVKQVVFIMADDMVCKARIVEMTITENSSGANIRYCLTAHQYRTGMALAPESSVFGSSQELFKHLAATMKDET